MTPTDVPTLVEVLTLAAHDHHVEGPLADSLYGIEQDCPKCGGTGEVKSGHVDDLGFRDCPTCHGSGKVLKGGLVERVLERAGIRRDFERPFYVIEGGAGAVLEALRRELENVEAGVAAGVLPGDDSVGTNDLLRAGAPASTPTCPTCGSPNPKVRNDDPSRSDVVPCDDLYHQGNKP